MELRQLVREIHWIEWQLRAFEDKYGLLSQDFYEAMESGQLSEFDDGERPQFTDFLEWHALYKIWLSRERAYRDLLHDQSLPAQLRHASSAA
ncbi:MAG: hypothetical protein ACK2UC_13575 [Anaerolineae bacterium]|jgi:hypothetical protein